MLVSDLQGFLRSLITPLRASGAKDAILADLERACGGLDPFEAYSIKDFADFLGRAKEFDQTGRLPVKGKPSRAPSSRAPKTPALSADDALIGLRTLYDRADANEVNEAEIRSGVARLDALTLPVLNEIAEQFGLGKSRTKKAALDAIERKVFSRRATTLRLQPIRE